MFSGQTKEYKGKFSNIEDTVMKDIEQKEQSKRSCGRGGCGGGKTARGGSDHVMSLTIVAGSDGESTPQGAASGEDRGESLSHDGASGGGGHGGSMSHGAPDSRRGSTSARNSCNTLGI